MVESYLYVKTMHVGTMDSGLTVILNADYKQPMHLKAQHGHNENNNIHICCAGYTKFPG
jgi:hypothetical protein